MKSIDSYQHVRGESHFVEDLQELQGSLYAVPIFSKVAHARIESMDFSEVSKSSGVRGVYSAKDIPGENQIGGIIQDEPLFAENEIHFKGQPLGLIVATSKRLAREAAKKIKLDVTMLEVITDPRIAFEKGEILFPPRTFENGQVGEAFANCAHVFEGSADSGGQEHLYIETQGSYAVPGEKGTIKIYSSTQGPTLVQKTTARVLGVPMYQVEVDVTRLGGAFGGKEDQATAWGVMAALAVSKLQTPVKLILDREDDMYVTGKRHPYSSDFKIGLDENLKIKAYEVTYYQNGGAAADLSPAILERTLFHVTNAYFIPNVRAKAIGCRTNLTPFTAFRGFGGPQAMFVIESAITQAAIELGIDRSLIQERNLLQKGDEFHYGQRCTSDNAVKSWNGLMQEIGPPSLKACASDKASATRGRRTKLETLSFSTYGEGIIDEMEEFNNKHIFRKKGWALMPVCFGISFTNTSMNQARALVHIYQDGSVSVSTGAIEMGQGVNTKLTQVASKSLGISDQRIRLETTNTRRVANTSPTAASSGSDLNGKATQIACDELLDRLKKRAAKQLGTDSEQIHIKDEMVWAGGRKTELDWERLINLTFMDRIQLSSVGHYATPEIHFDKTKEKGHPFAYHVFGTALCTVEVDCLLGTYEVESVSMVHDFGKTMNTHIDYGQVEGGLMQGIGWMTLEELLYDQDGNLLSNSLSKYKVPDVFSAPGKVNIFELETEGEPLAILRSKAVGEPPLMYGIGVYFAIQQAIRAFNPNYQAVYNAPMTPEKVLLGLYS